MIKERSKRQYQNDICIENSKIMQWAAVRPIQYSYFVYVACYIISLIKVYARCIQLYVCFVSNIAREMKECYSTNKASHESNI